MVGAQQAVGAFVTRLRFCSSIFVSVPFLFFLLHFTFLNYSYTSKILASSTAPDFPYLYLGASLAMLCLVVFAVFCASVRAASSEEKAIAGNLTTNGTGQVGWVSSRPGRSTSEILWSCATVLLVCTYKCVHLNLPSQEENEAGWHRIFNVPVWPEWPLLRKNLRQLKWMALIILAPELGVSVAYSQYNFAKAEAERCSGDQKMSLAHGFFAQMGGFVSESLEPSLPEEGGLLWPKTKSSKRHRQILTLDEYRKCFLYNLLPNDKSNALLSGIISLILGQLLIIVHVEVKICERNGYLVATEDIILDRTKADIFTKIFAIVQSTVSSHQCTPSVHTKTDC